MLPNAGTGLTVEQIQQIQQTNLRNAVKAAHCMRAHGITNFPDPAGTTQASGVNWQPVLSAIQAGGLSLNTPSYEAAFMTCNGKLVGGPIPPDFDPGQNPLAPPSGPPPGPRQDRHPGHRHRSPATDRKRGQPSSAGSSQAMRKAFAHRPDATESSSTPDSHGCENCTNVTGSEPRRPPHAKGS